MSPRPTSSPARSGPAAPGTETRAVAAEALSRIERDDVYANLALDAVLRRSSLDRRDRAMVTDLVYGTLRMRRACDHLVDRFLTSPPPDPARQLLRVGAYQLEFTDIPTHAAVSATAGAASNRHRGLVNAVLRRVATNPVTWPDEPTRLSYPDWLVARLVADLGEQDAVDALETMNLAPGVTQRADGYTQDLASQWVAGAVGAQPGQVVADLCAAPGGKATALASTGASVLALDLRPSRVGLVAANVADLELTGRVLPVVGDAGRPPLRTAGFDHVLLDAPCSGLGVLRRRADARWRITAADVDRLADLQRRLLVAAATLVRPGGTLTYSVCTLTRAETTGVADQIDALVPVEVRPLPVPEGPWRAWGSGALLLPQAADTDGMALFRWQVQSAR